MIEKHEEIAIKNINPIQWEYHRTSKKTYPKKKGLSFQLFFVDLMNLAPSSHKS